jgi:hypothetical protein
MKPTISRPIAVVTTTFDGLPVVGATFCISCVSSEESRSSVLKFRRASGFLGRARPIISDCRLIEVEIDAVSSTLVATTNVLMHSNGAGRGARSGSASISSTLSPKRRRDGVNVAARLESIAGSGEIFVSGTVGHQVRDKLDLIFDDMGEQTLKHIALALRQFTELRLAAAETTATPFVIDPRQALLAR